MMGTGGGAAGIGADDEAAQGACRLGHPRPSRARSGWMCPRCGLRVQPLAAPQCFEGHPRPADIETWTVWICPSDNEVVLPGDVSQDDVADANVHHPLFRPRRAVPWLGDVGVPDLTHRVVTFPADRAGEAHSWPIHSSPWSGAWHPPSTPSEASLVGFVPGSGSPAMPRSSTASGPVPSGARDPNDSLVTVAAPILAGFSLGTVAVIGTSPSLSARPHALPAMATFAGAAVLLLFSIQMLALGALPGLVGANGLRAAKAWLYEFGLLAFLAGLGLFLWPRTWSAATIAGLSAVGLAIVCDLVLVGAAWCRRNEWGRSRSAA